MKIINLLSKRALQTHRPCYPVPQYMSSQDAKRLSGSHDDLQKAYKKELAKTASQRNSNLIYEISCQLQPRLCGW